MYCYQDLKFINQIYRVLRNDDFANQGMNSSHILRYNIMLESAKSTTFCKMCIVQKPCA